MAVKPKVSVAFRFDGKNARAAKLAKAAGSKLITEITEEARKAIRAAIAKGIRDGIAPDDIARSLVGILQDTEAVTNIATTAYPGLIGLNTPQIIAALNYRDGLVKMGHTPEDVDKLLGRYAARKLRERAETIARTECMFALNAGAHAGYEQAMKQGYLPPDARLEWIVTPDENLCHDLCAPMAGKTKPIDPYHVTTFSNGVIAPPRHPRCRCTMAITFSEQE